MMQALIKDNISSDVKKYDISVSHDVDYPWADVNRW